MRLQLVRLALLKRWTRLRHTNCFFSELFLRIEIEVEKHPLSEYALLTLALLEKN